MPVRYEDPINHCRGTRLVYSLNASPSLSSRTANPVYLVNLACLLDHYGAIKNYCLSCISLGSESLRLHFAKFVNV